MTTPAQPKVSNRLSASTRMSADERRDTVLRAAAAAFAEGGYQGTSTEDVARRAGISQPYIFRLFGSKKELFLAVVEACFARTLAMFEAVVEGLEGEVALEAMGAAYQQLIQDPTILQVEMHSFTAAVHDPDVRRVAQRGMRRIWEMAAAVSGAPADVLRDWLAAGMLCNVLAALGLDQLDEPWAQQVKGVNKKDGSPYAELARSQMSRLRMGPSGTE